jgi:4-amino-4-deoxy-L-arabinose transferase-like glycosyltransferase
VAADRVANGPFGRSLGPRSLGEGGSVLPIVALAALVFLTGLGRLPLFGRDEALYAEAAREMQASGDWITPRVNGAFFFEKPPLLYWLDALAYSALGPTPLAARLPAALLGVLAIALTVGVTSRVWGRRAGVLAGVMLVTCPLVVMVARMGIMDMPLTLLITASMLLYARWRRNGGLAPAVGFGLLVGLAILLKGLAGGIAPAIAIVHSLVYRPTSLRRALSSRSGCAIAPSPRAERGRGGEVSNARVTPPSVALALIVAILVAAPWFIAMAHLHGEGYTAVFFIREHLVRMARPMQGHGGPVYYYLALIAFAFFPWVTFLPAALARRPPKTDGVTAESWSPGGQPPNPPSPDLERGPGGEADKPDQRTTVRPETDEQAFWRGLCLVWFLVVLVPFSLISTKLPGYILPLFPPMAMLVAAELDRRLAASLGAPPSRRPEQTPGRAPWIAAIVGAAILAAIFAALPLAALLSDVRRDVPNAGSLLELPSVLWSTGYLASLLGGVQGLRKRPRAGLALMAVGQLVVVGALLFAMLPVLSPYLGGGPAQLAQLAQRELPGRPIILYETRPETVNFVLRRTVPTFSHNQKDQLLAALRAKPSALIAPADEQDFWKSLPYRKQWRRGLDLLLDVSPPLKQGGVGVVVESESQPRGGDVR